MDVDLVTLSSGNLRRAEWLAVSIQVQHVQGHQVPGAGQGQGVGQRGVECPEVLFRQGTGGFVAGADDLLLGGEAHQLRLGILELDLQLLELVFQIGLGVAGGLEARLQVAVLVGRGQGVGGQDGEGRVGAVVVDLDSTPIAAALGLPSLPLLGQRTVNANVGSGSANDVPMVGYPDPTVTTSYSFEASQGVGNLLTNLNTGVGALNGILTVLATNPTLRAALNSLGGGLDEILEVLGLEANEVVVQVDNMDCFNTAVLTR